MSNSIVIFSAKKISTELVSLAGQFNIRLHSEDLLSIKTLNPNEFQTRLLSNRAPFVFTSQHAVKAVEPLFEKLLNFATYCTLGRTLDVARAIGFKVIDTAPNAAELSQKVCERNEKQVLHCTCSKRRDEMETILGKNGVDYQALHVYQKNLTPKKIESADAYFFFSPSQVNSFLQKNELPADVPVFCIGETTKQHLEKFGHLKLLVANEPRPEAMVKMCIEYFKK